MQLSTLVGIISYRNIRLLHHRSPWFNTLRKIVDGLEKSYILRITFGTFCNISSNLSDLAYLSILLIISHRTCIAFSRLIFRT
uniref:Uncharacterized protein n=1 Tax=Anopheles christyi TaxID=43041 RepID=A0A182KJ51_9DIPT